MDGVLNDIIQCQYTEVITPTMNLLIIYKENIQQLRSVIYYTTRYDTIKTTSAKKYIENVMFPRLTPLLCLLYLIIYTYYSFAIEEI